MGILKYFSSILMSAKNESMRKFPIQLTSILNHGNSHYIFLFIKILMEILKYFSSILMSAKNESVASALNFETIWDPIPRNKRNNEFVPPGF